jgi:hypothetical protein
MATNKRNVILAGFAALLAGPLWTAPAATANPSPASAYNGSWSVLIVTDAGDCDRAYRYALQIANGRISYPNSSFDISGRVDASGRVRVNVSAGGQQASGTGRLAGNYGQGSWSGASSTGRCSGHWEAERRSTT